MVNQQLSLRERAEYAKDKKNSPYPEKFASLDGGPWGGHIFCGDNPMLWARKVDDLRIEVDEDGEEHLIWTDHPLPDLSKFRGAKRASNSE